MKQIGSSTPDYDIILSCPPMLLSIEKYESLLTDKNLRMNCPEFTAVIPEDELIGLIPKYDGWIIGDDQATAAVFQAGEAGKLKAAVKWGVGVDNVDFDGAKRAGIPVTNTPGMFSDEVADMAMGYTICLARKIINVHCGVIDGNWPKPVGMSLRGKRAAVVGYGNIGREFVNRLLAFGVEVIVYDPFLKDPDTLPENVSTAVWPDKFETADFLILACSLTEENQHLVNSQLLESCKRGLNIVNVSRGPLIDERALLNALQSGQVAGAALDVAEIEPLPPNSPLRNVSNCIFGSHNGSNTQEAVDRTSMLAINLIYGFLNNEQS